MNIAVRTIQRRKKIKIYTNRSTQRDEYMNIYLHTYTFICYLIRCVNNGEATSNRKKPEARILTAYVHILRVRSFLIDYHVKLHKPG